MEQEKKPIGTEAGASEAAPPELKKPSILSQVVPYALAVGILAYVFTGLSNNVVDERHVLRGDGWVEVIKSGAKPKSVEVKSIDGQTEYCSVEVAAKGGDQAQARGCPPGGDFEVRPESGPSLLAVRRTAGSRIGDGVEVSIDYVEKVTMAELWATIKQADLRLFLPIMILHVLIFALGDTLSFGLAYRFFNTPKMPFKELLEVRLAPYVIQIALTPLAEVLFPLYMYRVKKVPITQCLSSNLWTVLTDLTVSMTILTVAVSYNLKAQIVPVIGRSWLIGCIGYWIVVAAALLYWKTPFAEKTRAKIAAGELGILRTFSLARARHYLAVYLIRLVIGISATASNYIALRAMGVVLPPALALIAIPIIVMSVFLPISVGGYGGPQLVAWFMIVMVGKVGTADQVLAYSFLWCTCFLIGRGVIGLIFIRGFWKRCFPQGFSLGKE